MPGFANDSSGNSIMWSDNVDFSGNVIPSRSITVDGQLLIGSTATPNIRVGTLTPGSGITITNGAGSITISAGASVPTTFTTDSGNAIPAGNIINDFGSGSITTSGAGNTITTQLTGLTNHAVLIGAGTSTITKVGPVASTGNVLMSNGLSSDPGFSTATYPATAGTLGNILTSDGTNWNSSAPATTIITINGDSGSVTGSTVTIFSNNAVNNSGSTVKFVNSGTTSTLNLTDVLNNVFLGSGAGNLLVSGANNSSQGRLGLASVTSGDSNCSLGSTSLTNLTTGNNNVAMGVIALQNLVSGNDCIGIGRASGQSYTSSESNNICIGSSVTGTIGESNTTRIGNGSSACIVSGINGVTVTGQPVNISSTGQLGTITAGSSGQLFQSSGASSPAWTTATYPSTTTINQILYSSAANTVTGLSTANNGTLITSSSGVPSLLANGTTGQVLTATTGSPPSWQNASTPTNQTQVVTFYEEFEGSNVASNLLTATYLWGVNSNSFSVAATNEAQHPGKITSGAYSSSSAQIGLPGNAFILTSNILSLTMIFNIANLSNGTNRYTLRLGVGDTVNADQVNGVYFEYSDNINSGNWVLKTSAASSRTTTNTAVAVATGWHNFTITVSGGTATYFLDGVSLGTNAATIPTAGVGPWVDAARDAGTIAANTFQIDMISYQLTLASAR